MYSLNANNVSKSSVHDLLSYYKRQKLNLRDEDTCLVRPIARPDFVVNNDEIRTLEVLGKVCVSIILFRSIFIEIILRVILVKLNELNIVEDLLL